jgi:hypothetical protein
MAQNSVVARLQQPIPRHSEGIPQWMAVSRASQSIMAAIVLGIDAWTLSLRANISGVTVPLPQDPFAGLIIFTVSSVSRESNINLNIAV